MSLLGFDAIGRWALGQHQPYRQIVGLTGAFAETGGAFTFITSGFLVLSPGAFLFTGNSVTFTFNYNGPLVPAGEQWAQRTGFEYAVGFNNLLPTGPAWPRSQGTDLQDVVSGLAAIWGDPVETLAALLLTQESDPRTANILLPDWENAFGLPDVCDIEPRTVGTRQTKLVQKMTLLGAQSRAFMIQMAATINYTITITEYRPFIVGIDAVGDNRIIGTGGPMRWPDGDLILDPVGFPVGLGVYSEYPYMLGPPENGYYWTVHVTLASLTWFRVSKGQCGVDPHLVIGLATDLQCLLNRYAPAHTQIVFDYSNLGIGGAMAGTP
jgi:uncharacterized protein YmfQ (DUF2313 family)